MAPTTTYKFRGQNSGQKETQIQVQACFDRGRLPICVDIGGRFSWKKERQDSYPGGGDKEPRFGEHPHPQKSHSSRCASWGDHTD